MAKFSEGQRVRLNSNAIEGWPEEFGHIVDVEDDNGMYVVQVDQRYWDDGDDGIREVGEEQMDAV